MTNDMPLNDLRWIGYSLRAAAGAEEGSWRVRVAGNRRLAVSRRRSARVVPEASGPRGRYAAEITWPMTGRPVAPELVRCETPTSAVPSMTAGAATTAACLVAGFISPGRCRCG